MMGWWNNVDGMVLVFGRDKDLSIAFPIHGDVPEVDGSFWIKRGFFNGRFITVELTDVATNSGCHTVQGAWCHCTTTNGVVE